MENITMPQLGESVTEGTIIKWFVKPGDTVNKYDPIAEVMTDKVNAEVPSSFAGKIKEIVAEEGETVSVGVTICTIEAEGQSTEKASQPQQVEEVVQAPAKSTEGKVRYSPAVLKLSQENGINLANVKGTGKEGRITRKDVLKYLETGREVEVPVATEPEITVEVQSQPVQKAKEQTPVIEKSVVPTISAGDNEIPVSGIRRAIANNMVKSKHEIPHAWTMIEVDVTNLVSYRDKLKASFKQKEGYNLTYFAFFVKAVAQALKEFPEINSMWAGDKIVQKKDINISIAVATDDALYVPVIKHADELSIKGIAREITELATKVRKGKLRTEDMQDGTFTVNNTGSFGSVQSMAIINHPQAGILQVESIVKRPVVINDMIAIRSMVNLCMSIDHRVLDGLIVGRFLQRVKQILEATSEQNTPIY